MFQSEPSLFLSANKNVYCAKTLINECKAFINNYEVPENGNFAASKKSINACNIDGLLKVVDKTKGNLLKLDKEFSEAYISMLEENLNTGLKTNKTMSDEEIMQYNLIIRDYDYALLAILEQYESSGMLNDEMKSSLNKIRKKIKVYELTDEMSLLSPSSSEYIDKFKQKAKLDLEIINSTYSEAEAKQKIKEYNDCFYSTLEVLELNNKLDTLSNELSKLNYGSEEYYKKEKEIMELQINYYKNKEKLTAKEQKSLNCLEAEIKLNQLYIEKEQNNGIFHPFIESEYNEAILQKKVEIGKINLESAYAATTGEIEYAGMNTLERSFENTKTVLATHVTSMAGVMETMTDGLLLLTVGNIGKISDNDDLLKWTEDAVNTKWSDDAYDGLVQKGYLNSYSAYSNFNIVTDFVSTTATYAGLALIPGIGTSSTAVASSTIVANAIRVLGTTTMVTSAAGNAGQTSLENGATIEEAIDVSTKEGITTLMTDIILDQFNAKSNLSTVQKLLGRTAIGVGEPLVNTLIEYSEYGNKNFDNIFDYANATNAYTNMLIGGIITNTTGIISDIQTKKAIEIDVEGSNGSIIDQNNVVVSRNIIAKGGSYDNLDEICAKYGITREDYFVLTRTKQHNMTDSQRKLTFDIRKELTMDVTDSAGVLLPGTKVSKSIDAATFAQHYKDGDPAVVKKCIALERDTSVLGGNATEIIDSTGLRFDGSKFVDASGSPNEFYIVEGTLSAGQPDVAIRISATTDATEISDTVLDQFRKNHPDYKYNGYDIADVSSANNTYLNEIWTRNSESQVKMLSETSGISEKNIVTEPAKDYNRSSNPDMGNGTTLHQGDPNTFGLPEFYAKDFVGLSEGAIYKISNGKKIKVVDIIGGIVYHCKEVNGG